MKEVIVTSQEELDALHVDFDGKIIIKFGTPDNRAIVNRRFKYSVVARDSAYVEARDSASVEARGSASVVARGSASVVARGSAYVEARDSAYVEAWDSASVVAWGSAYVVAWGSASVEARDSAYVEASGNSQVCDNTISHKITTTANARIVYNPRNIDEYCAHHQIERTGNTVTLYKAVHKRDGCYFSDADNSFMYEIGGVAVADRLTEDPFVDCGHGIHMAHKAWCVDYGRDWNDLAILEVEAEASNIVVPVPNCGKVRAAQVKVIREVPLEECGLLGKMIAKKLEKK